MRCGVKADFAAPGANPLRQKWVRPREGRPIALLSSTLALAAAGLLAQAFLPVALCGPNAFLCGGLGAGSGVAGFVLISLAGFALTLAAVVRLRVPQMQRAIARRAAGLMVGAGAVLVTGVLLSTAAALSYYCAAPDAILLHATPLSAARRVSWGDVTAVQATCLGGARAPVQGALDLTFKGGDGLRLSLGQGASLAERYQAIRAALAGRRYHYEVSNAGLCPHRLYMLFADWRADDPSP
jgi:hypothetical protein